MIEIIIVSVVAWFVSEGSFLVQQFKHWYNIDRIPVLDCPKCLAFWFGLLWFSSYGVESLVYAILCSSLALFISKVYNRI